MEQHLTADDFNHLVRYFTREAFRLEVRSVYLVEDEQENLAQYLRGEPYPVTEVPYYSEWLADIRRATVEGRRVSRVRVLDEPPTDLGGSVQQRRRRNAALPQPQRCP